MRKSRFAYYLYIEGKYLLFHMLTRQLLLMAPEMIGWFIGDRTFSSDALGEEEAAFLWENWFLVPADHDETRTWREVREILRLGNLPPEGISNFVILPTADCNAHCFYCFEQGMARRTMSPETAAETVRFISAHCPARGKIHIHWFGGEPTCAPEVLDGLCAGLAKAGVDFTAEMTSNGSLFTPEMARHAREVWKAERVQITLDGLAAEYAARKCYSPEIAHPFETVTGNIRNLLAAGVKVVVRLNVDENNVSDIFRTVTFLGEYYTPEERQGMTVYAHALFGGRNEMPVRDCPAGTGSDELEEAVLRINEALIRQGLMKKDLGELLQLKIYACRAAAPAYNALIDAEGRIFACDGMPERMRIGDLRKGIDHARFAEVSAPCIPEDRCAGCAFLPQCTDFNRCPNRLPFDACRRQEKRKLDSDLRLLYYIYREKQEKGSSEP